LFQAAVSIERSWVNISLALHPYGADPAHEILALMPSPSFSACGRIPRIAWTRKTLLRLG
ncbi:MAG: hypothetical protein ACR2QH_08100, partial [Geminicoccaceae bacterium]